MRADSGAKFDQGGIHKILALIHDLSDHDLGILIDRLLKERAVRNQAKGSNEDTIQV